MGGAGLPWLVYGAFVAVLLLMGLFAFAPWARGRRDRSDELARSMGRGDGVVPYEVPSGQDPAAVLDALASADVAASSRLEHGRQLVLIDTDGGDPGAVRERARRAIAAAPLNTQEEPAPRHAVVFLDE